MDYVGRVYPLPATLHIILIECRDRPTFDRPELNPPIVQQPSELGHANHRNHQACNTELGSWNNRSIGFNSWSGYGGRFCSRLRRCERGITFHIDPASQLALMKSRTAQRRWKNLTRLRFSIFSKRCADRDRGWTAFSFSIHLQRPSIKRTSISIRASMKVLKSINSSFIFDFIYFSFRGTRRSFHFQFWIRSAL